MVLYKFDVSSFIYFSLDELFSCLFCFVVIIIIIKRKPEVLKERGTFLIIGLAVFAIRLTRYAHVGFRRTFPKRAPGSHTPFVSGSNVPARHRFGLPEHRPAMPSIRFRVLFPLPSPSPRQPYSTPLQCVADTNLIQRNE